MTKAFKPDEIYPPLMAKLTQLQANCQAKGVDYWLISGYRSWEEQDKLYALGRTAKNVDATPAKPMGGIVTKAKGGQSYHNFGVAADFAPDKDKTRAGLQPDWDLKSYELLADEALKLGLDPGLYWKTFKDGPHVQLPLAKHGIKLSDLQKWWKKGGTKEVWTQLDKYTW